MISPTLIGTTTSAQTTEPLLLPRLSFGDLSYAGGFRLPAEASNDETFGYGGQALAFNAERPSLFVASRVGRVAEVSIPAAVVSTDVNDMPFAEYLQGFADPTEGRITQVSKSEVVTNSLMVFNGRLYGTASIYYDALNDQRVSHFSRSLGLTDKSFKGWSQVWETGRSGYVAGNLALVPEEWQSKLGGVAVSGQCCVPIVSRTSLGPAAFAFDPAEIGQPVVAASPLLYYTLQHPTLGTWDAKKANPTYNTATAVGGMVLVAGTRTALYFGRTGLGENCYGKGTDDPSLHGKKDPSDDGHWCYDPTSIYKGTHAYPYQYQIWAYDLNDLADVKAGKKQPWEIVPYDVWPFAFPTAETSVSIGGVSYDAATQTIFVAQSYADRDGYAHRPIIHVLRVGGTGQPLQAAPTTPSTSAPSSPAAPGPMTPVTGLTVSANKTAPQTLGNTITFSANASGGNAPNQFKWQVLENGSWVTRADWSTASTFTWTPAAASSYQVVVWARSGRSRDDAPQSQASMWFRIEEANNTGAVSSVTVSANRTAPQQPGTAVTFNASANGGTGRNEFKWLLFDGASWVTRAEWGPSNTFTWTPAASSGLYQVQVWARAGGNTADQPQASATMRFPIEAPAAMAAPVSSVGITSTVSPQPVGTPLSFVATPQGGSGPHQYKWRTFDGASWTVRADWSASNRFTWTPPAAGNAYRIEVWVRSAGKTADVAESSLWMPFVVTPR